MRRSIAALLAIAFALACAGDSGNDGNGNAREETAMAEGPPPVSGDTTRMSSGLQYIVISPGDGPAPQTGQRVRVHYTGWLTDGRQFDSSRDRGQPFAFTLGRGQVIRGWDEGVALMRVGGQRRLILPSELAYGERGAGNVIPPGATLVFDVELLGIEE